MTAGVWELQSLLERDSDSTEIYFQHCLPILVFLFTFFFFFFLNSIVSHTKQFQFLSSGLLTVSTLSRDRTFAFQWERKTHVLNAITVFIANLSPSINEKTLTRLLLGSDNVANFVQCHFVSKLNHKSKTVEHVVNFFMKEKFSSVCLSFEQKSFSRKWENSRMLLSNTSKQNRKAFVDSRSSSFHEKTFINTLPNFFHFFRSAFKQLQFCQILILENGKLSPRISDRPLEVWTLCQVLGFSSRTCPEFHKDLNFEFGKISTSIVLDRRQQSTQKFLKT